MAGQQFGMPAGCRPEWRQGEGQSGHDSPSHVGCTWPQCGRRCHPATSCWLHSSPLTW